MGLRLAAFRHIVFPEAARGGPPVNFAAADGMSLCAPAAPRTAATEEQSFLRWLFELGGLDCSDYKIETLRRRVPSCLRALRVSSLADARQLLNRNPSLLRIAISSLVIGVTGFFRDAAVFSALADRVLPDLTSRGSAARIWSVGCSDGAELYSVSMLLADHGVLHRCYLLGTDCRGDAVKRAADGVYDAEAMKSVPREFAERYFTFDLERWRIHSFLRTVVQWRTANVLTVNEPGAWDMILCRNLAIYLRAAAAARLWQTLMASLRPGGILVLGKAERPLGADGLSAVGPCMYRRNRS
jgi:chemotaxis methyl-accepting protein methylase